MHQFVNFNNGKFYTANNKKSTAYFHNCSLYNLFAYLIGPVFKPSTLVAHWFPGPYLSLLFLFIDFCFFLLADGKAKTRIGAIDYIIARRKTDQCNICGALSK